MGGVIADTGWKDEKNMMIENIRCPVCNNKKGVIRKGRRKIRFGYRQLYFCKDCGKGFVEKDRSMSNKTYNPKVILNAISYYNLGSTLNESAKLTNRRFKINVSKSSVHQWLKDCENICTYHKLRPGMLKSYGKNKNILFSKTFEHKGLAYNFRYHKPKLEKLCQGNSFHSLKEYIGGFEKNGCPAKFFEEGGRCSQLSINVRNFRRERDYNNACKLVTLALKLCNSNRERHSVVEKFMLINDSSTVACEVPVWFWEKNLGLGVCGHIDLIQIRNNKIYVMDFKPDARKENGNRVASQLFLYASGLSFRTGTGLDRFRCAWFDDKDYFEFKPKECRVGFPRVGNVGSE
ncbi:MAG: hypothetical protein KJ886_01245 [Candidatus Thermoplasmatota archaeon]|nr:hypothetical protein [Candidatus Thermoplasmatota archaeon]MCG2826081.1 hypothetical protein [Thermoplasmatales archaeon]